jgi:hypothetical protein
VKDYVRVAQFLEPVMAIGLAAREPLPVKYDFSSGLVISA